MQGTLVDITYILVNRPRCISILLALKILMKGDRTYTNKHIPGDDKAIKMPRVA